MASCEAQTLKLMSLNSLTCGNQTPLGPLCICIKSHCEGSCLEFSRVMTLAAPYCLEFPCFHGFLSMRRAILLSVLPAVQHQHASSVALFPVILAFAQLRMYRRRSSMVRPLQNPLLFHPEWLYRIHVSFCLYDIWHNPHPLLFYTECKRICASYEVLLHACYHCHSLPPTLYSIYRLSA